MRRRATAIAARWFDVVLLAASTYAAVLLLLVILPAGCKRLADLPTWLWAPVVAAAAVWTAAAIVGGRASTSSGLRHFWAYPPAWAAVPGAVGALMVHVRAFPTTPKFLGCPLDGAPFVSHAVALAIGGGTIAAVGVAGVIAARWATWRDRVKVLGSKPASPAAAASDLGRDQKALLEWIADDRPVSAETSDYFGRTRLADKVTEYVTAESRPTIAVVGPVGSGKSSVKALVERRLARDGVLGRSVVTCSLSLWPFDAVDAAVRGVLEALNGAFARHVNTLPLRAVPGQYADAIEAGAGSFAAFAKLLHVTPSPQQLLAKYDAVAVALGLRVVVWVEDVERFARGVDDRRELDRLEPVRALLSELSACSSIQIVLSVAHVDGQFDLEKLVRFAVPLPPLLPRDVFALLSRFRDACALGEVVDPVDRSALWKAEGFADDDAQLRTLFGVLGEQRALALLCSTPRILKQGLRACYDAWSGAKGNIDFDDALVLSLIRVAEPRVFGLIADHINELRYGTGSSEGNQQTQFSLELRSLLGEASQRRAIIELLVALLFPAWKTGKPREQTSKAQGVAATHTDYWARYLEAGRPSGVVDDQVLLRGIENWRSGAGADEFPELLVTADEARLRLEAFALATVRRQDLVRLLGDVVELEKRRSPRQWSSRGEPESIISVWRMMLRSHPPESDLAANLRSLLPGCFPSHLGLAQSLMHYFVTPSRDVQWLINDKNLLGTTRDDFESLLVRSYVGRPDLLARALAEGPKYLLLWACWGLDRVRDGRYLAGVPFGDWAPLSDTILDAAIAEPRTVLPEVLPFVLQQAHRMGDITEEDRPRLRTEFVYQPETARRVFKLDRFRQAVGAASSLPEVLASDEYRAVEAGLRAEPDETA
jgi:hypothetical protein